MFNKELLRGTLKPLILSVLAEKDSLYGYEINKMVAERTSDKIKLTEGALYPMLHKLEKDGLVTTELVNIGSRMRKYYKLTSKGKTASRETVSELQSFIETIELFLTPNKAGT